MISELATVFIDNGSEVDGHNIESNIQLLVSELQRKAKGEEDLHHDKTFDLLVRKYQSAKRREEEGFLAPEAPHVPHPPATKPRKPTVTVVGETDDVNFDFQKKQRISIRDSVLPSSILKSKPLLAHAPRKTAQQLARDAFFSKLPKPTPTRCPHCRLLSDFPSISHVRPRDPAYRRSHDLSATSYCVTFGIQTEEEVDAMLWDTLAGMDLPSELQEETLDSCAYVLKSHVMGRIGPPPWAELFLRKQRAEQRFMTQTALLTETSQKRFLALYSELSHLRLSNTALLRTLNSSMSDPSDTIESSRTQVETVRAELGEAERDTQALLSGIADTKAQRRRTLEEIAVTNEEIRRTVSQLQELAQVARLTSVPIRKTRDAVAEVLSSLATVGTDENREEPVMEQCPQCLLLRTAGHCPMTGEQHITTEGPVQPPAQEALPTEVVPPHEDSESETETEVLPKQRSVSQEERKSSGRDGDEGVEGSSAVILQLDIPSSEPHITFLEEEAQLHTDDKKRKQKRRSTGKSRKRTLGGKRKKQKEVAADPRLRPSTPPLPTLREEAAVTPSASHLPVLKTPVATALDPSHQQGDWATSSSNPVLAAHISDFLSSALSRDTSKLRNLVRRMHTGPVAGVLGSSMTMSLRHAEEQFAEWFDLVQPSLGTSVRATRGVIRAAGATDHASGGVMKAKILQLTKELRNLSYAVTKRPKGRSTGATLDDNAFQALANRLSGLEKKHRTLGLKLRQALAEQRSVQKQLAEFGAEVEVGDEFGEGTTVSPETAANESMLVVPSDDVTKNPV